MDEGSREIKASMPGVHGVASFLFPLDIHHQKKYIYMFDTYLFFRTTADFFEIDNIKCKLKIVAMPIYPTIIVEERGYTDITQKPQRIVNRSYINWECNDIAYSITAPDNFELETAKELVKDYMNSLK